MRSLAKVEDNFQPDVCWEFEVRLGRKKLILKLSCQVGCVSPSKLGERRKMRQTTIPQLLFQLVVQGICSCHKCLEEDSHFDYCFFNGFETATCTLMFVSQLYDSLRAPRKSIAGMTLEPTRSLGFTAVKTLAY